MAPSRMAARNSPFSVSGSFSVRCGDARSRLASSSWISRPPFTPSCRASPLGSAATRRRGANSSRRWGSPLRGLRPWKT
eukprot:9024163-Lingulodinium_polyedra.AAC.1